MAITFKHVKLLSLASTALGLFSFAPKVFADLPKPVAICVESDGSGGTLNFYNPSDRLMWVPYGTMDNSVAGAIYCFSQSLFAHGASVWNTASQQYVQGQDDNGDKDAFGYTEDYNEHNAFLKLQNNQLVYVAGSVPSYSFHSSIAGNCKIVGFYINSTSPLGGIDMLTQNYWKFNDDDISNHQWEKGAQANIILSIFYDYDGYSNYASTNMIIKDGENSSSVKWIPPGNYNIIDIQGVDLKNCVNKDPYVSPTIVLEPTESK